MANNKKRLQTTTEKPPASPRKDGEYDCQRYHTVRIKHPKCTKKKLYKETSKYGLFKELINRNYPRKRPNARFTGQKLFSDLRRSIITTKMH